MTATSQRAIATCRSFTGTRSPITAIPIGKMPPAAAPATTRATMRSREVRRETAHEHRDNRDRKARHHDADLADHVSDGTEHRLNQRERQREGGGQQRNGVGIDLDVMRDRRDDRVGRARGERGHEPDQAHPQDQAADFARIRWRFGQFRLGLRGDGQKIAVERPAGLESGLEIHVAGESHTRISAGLLCSAGMPHPTIAWGRKRDVFLVIGLISSRTERPQGSPAAIQDPSTT